MSAHDWVDGCEFTLQNVTLHSVFVNPAKTCWTVKFKDAVDIQRTVKLFKRTVDTIGGEITEGTVIPALVIKGKADSYNGEDRLEFIGSVPSSGGGGGGGKWGGGGKGYTPKSPGSEHGASICGLLKTKAEKGLSIRDFWVSVGLYAQCIEALDGGGIKKLLEVAAKKAGEERAQ